MFLFKQHISTDDIPTIQAYNHICSFLKISKNIIFTDACEVFMIENTIFHTNYISEIYKSSYIIVTNLYDLKVLQTLRGVHKIILIYSEKPDDENILFIDNNQDINNTAYAIEAIIK